MLIQARLFTLVLLLALMIAGPIHAQDPPQDVVGAFLDAWNQADYERMYSLIHDESREAMPQQAFVNRYQQVQNV
ncbi:MAG: NTF2-like N-terminal transpeptidase domain-containing protein, partial [Phototrophicaceae bacterium]